MKPAGCWWLPRGAGVWPPDAGCLCSHGFSSQPLVTPHRRGLCLSRQTRPGPAGFHRGTAGAARTAFSLSCSRAEPGAHESSVLWAHGFLSPLQGWAVVAAGDRLFSHVLFTRILWDYAQGGHARAGKAGTLSDSWGAPGSGGSTVLFASPGCLFRSLPDCFTGTSVQAHFPLSEGAELGRAPLRCAHWQEPQRSLLVCALPAALTGLALPTSQVEGRVLLPPVSPTPQPCTQQTLS